MIKYFCDLCNKEVEVFYNIKMLDYDTDLDNEKPLKYRRELCCDCWLKLHEFIELGSQKEVE